MSNDPSQVKLFTKEESARASERLRLEAIFPDEEKVTMRAVLSVYTSLHTWPVFVIMFCSGCAVFGLAFFAPSIVLGMGFSPIRTQLMTVPPFAIAFVVCILTAYVADRYRKRGAMALATISLALIGVIMFYRGRTTAIRYTALFFLITGNYACGPCLLAWVPNNTAAHTRRATAIATAFCLTNSGGLVSTWIFPTSDGPYYPFASKFILSLVLICMAAIATELYILSYLNKRKEDPVYREKVLRPVQGLDFAQQMVVLGDGHPDYKYIL
jgi:cyanate permease